MSQAIRFRAQLELAGKVKVDAQKVRYPHYGRYLEEFVPGQVFVHPRGFTFFAAQMEAFARTCMQCNPLYLNDQYARAAGFSGLLASPQMVFNVVLSLGVQNDSEKAMANLGYYDAVYLRPVHAMDTLRSLTKVIDRKDARCRQARNRHHPDPRHQPERPSRSAIPSGKIMVAEQGDRPPTTPLPASAHG
jgi:2-methylfumaryl-CoA hydratase